MSRVSVVRDLGVLLDEEWTFNNHIDHVIAVTSKMVGFIKRATYCFNSGDCLSYLYKSLVLPHFTYCSIIWQPFTRTNYERLNSITRNFLRYTAYKMGCPMSFDDHSYETVSSKLNIYTIESYHQVCDLLFAYSAICSSGTNDNQFHFDMRTRAYDLRYSRPLLESQSRSNLLYYSH